MRVGGRGYDPFWGHDPLRYVEPERIQWEKPKKMAASSEDDEKFFGNVLKANKTVFVDESITRPRLNIKV